MAVGGLKIIGSERHESRRIDNQLRGRSGRQGDPGETRFYISLEDDLMKIFLPDRIVAMVDMLGLPEDVPIEQKMLTGAIETAQRKIEGRNYSIRKNVLEYDDVMNTQREIIYGQRRDVLNTADISEIIMKLAEAKVTKIVDSYISDAANIDDIDFESLNAVLFNLFSTENMLQKSEIEILDNENVIADIMNKVKAMYNEKHEEAKKSNTNDSLEMVERFLVLRVVNQKWMDHIDAISDLKDGIGLRAYSQTNPLEAYKIECFNMFEELVDTIQEEATKAVFSIKAQKQENYTNVTKNVDTITNISTNSSEQNNQKREPVKSEKKVGRNEPCPCGSGKKYKQCCGK